MSSTYVHKRLYRIEDTPYADGEVISPNEFDELAAHYYSIVEALARPWLDRDKYRDSLGRINPSCGGQDGEDDE